MTSIHVCSLVRSMIGAEQISVNEFRQIMAADLEACCEAFDLRAEYLRLRKQRLRLWGMAAFCLLAIALMVFWLTRDPALWMLYVAAAGILLIVLLVILRANLQLERRLRHICQCWQEAHLLNSSPELMEFITDLARKVKDYNHWVKELQQSLQEGQYWRDFRQLNEAEQKYIQTVFLQVRAQLVIALQIGRQLIENPQASVDEYFNEYFNQLVSRDQQLLNQFTAKNMTTNRYVIMAQELSNLEADLQTQLQALRSR
ncbi:MAG: hypothetical protein ACUVRV_00200 [Cyanobacteriota bacterium]